MERGKRKKMSEHDSEELVLSTFKNQQNRQNTISRYNPIHYIFYSIVNSSVCMDQGTCASAVARGFLILHNKIEDNRTMNEYLYRWEENGENIIVLKGFNEKHLKYLKTQLRPIAIATHSLIQSYGKQHVTLVLTVFGQQGNMNKWLGGLPALR